MSGTVILIDHPVGQRDDRASRILTERGYRIAWRCPGKGETLPEPGPGHVGAIVYGWIERWLETGKPFLGLCLGGQMLARVLGARVDPHPEALYEIGYVPIETAAGADGFLDGVSHVYHWHHEGFTVPAGAELLATGPVFPNQAYRYGRNAYGLQFHPEVTVPVMTRWMKEAGAIVKSW